MKTYKRSLIHKNNLKVFLNIYKKDGKVSSYRSGSVKRFFNKIQACSHARINIKVEYGKDKDCFGKTVMFYNEYDGENKVEAIAALKAFIE